MIYIYIERDRQICRYKSVCMYNCVCVCDSSTVALHCVKALRCVCVSMTTFMNTRGNGQSLLSLRFKVLGFIVQGLRF